MDSSPQGDRHTSPLALIERLDRDGHVVQSVPVYRWPVSIGRSFEADVVLDDPHLAAVHARLSEDDGALRLSLGQTINGAVVGSRHLQAGESMILAPAQAWRLGGVRVRVRRASDPLAPEQPLARHLVLSAINPVGATWSVLSMLTIAVILWTLGEQWLSNDPGAPMNTYLSSVLMMLVVAGGWALFWALGSKLFQGRLQYLVHLKLALGYGLVWSAVVMLLPMLGFVTGWDLLSRTADGAGAIVLCMLVWSHLGLILPGHRQGLAAGMAALYITALGLNLWINEQRIGRVFSEMYASTLLPPGWRLAPTQPTTVLIDDARSLKGKLDALAKDEDADEPADVGDQE